MKSRCALLVMCGAALMTGDALATDLRGKVQVRNQFRADAFAGAGVPVRLYSTKAPKQWAKIATATTDSDGMYYFPDVAPGTYVLQIGGANFRLEVPPRPFQDISPVTIQK